MSTRPGTAASRKRKKEKEAAAVKITKKDAAATADDANAAVSGMQGIEIDGRAIETRIDRKA